MVLRTLTTLEMEAVLGSDAVVLNVLAGEHFEQAHIPGSRNAPVDDPGFISKVESLAEDRSTPVVVHCSGPPNSASRKAAVKLEGAGFTTVFHYAGGMMDWIAAGRELERETSTAGTS